MAVLLCLFVVLMMTGKVKDQRRFSNLNNRHSVTIFGAMGCLVCHLENVSVFDPAVEIKHLFLFVNFAQNCGEF